MMTGWAGLAALLLLLLSLCVASVSLGAGSFSFAALAGGPDAERAWRLLLVSRVPRTLALLLAGMALAVAGLIMQMLVRNRYVEPTTAGTVESATLGILAVTLLAPDTQDEARRLVALMDGLQARLTAAQAAIDRQRAAQQRPTGSDTGSHRGPLPSTPTPTGTPSSNSAPGQRPPTGGGPTAPDSAGPTATPTGTPSSDPSSVQVSVPIGSSDTTLTLPTLVSGLPPIGITIGNSGPATGPTTGGTPNTDPNPN